MISIIVPVYNVERHLGECLASLAAQTRCEVEVICVDDGSTDAGGSICDAWAKNSEATATGAPVFRVIHKLNEGLAAARNDGLAVARGEWIMFVDADDYLDPDTCHRALAAANDHRADIVLWSYAREFANGRTSVRRLAAGDRLFEGEAMRALHRLVVGPVGNEVRDPSLLHSWGTAWGKLYRRETIGEVRFVDTRVIGTEDALFNVEVFGRAARAFHIDRPMYHYRKSESSLTANHNARLEEGWARLHAMIGDAIDNGGWGEDFHRALDNRVALAIISRGINELYSPRVWSEKIAEIRRFISSDEYRRAIVRLPLRRLPIHWRLFFAAARSQRAATLLWLVRAIERLRS
jgi:glycosyltransferase EpsH